MTSGGRCSCDSKNGFLLVNGECNCKKGLTHASVLNKCVKCDGESAFLDEKSGKCKCKNPNFQLNSAGETCLECHGTGARVQI